MENLGRGALSVRSGTGNLVSWRLLGSDPHDIAFHVYRGSTRLTPSPLTSSTNYLDAGAAADAAYTVRAVVGGVEQPAADPALRLGNGYLDVPLQVPAGGRTPDGVAYTYSANDASVGDLDGDGEYEIVVKWDPSNAKDNSQSGYTGDVYLDAYELSGARLWRIDLGRNIRAGAHYTQFQVYDYDGDGRDEIVYGSMAVDDDGTGRWNTRNGHGDAMHVGDLVPARPGLEVFKVDEDASKPSSWMADAATGQVLWTTPPNGDNGRGVSGDIWDGSPGAESWSASGGDGILDTSGRVVGRKPSSTNFLVWLRVYSTPSVTDRRIVTLMHDPQYRVAVAWQNTAYNQPPHPSFFIGAAMPAPPWPDVHTAR